MVFTMGSENSRLSITLNKELENQLRKIQASMIKKSKKNVSFSFVVNLVIEEGLKRKRDFE